MDLSWIFFIFFFGIALAVIARKTVVITNSSERAVIFRFEKFFAVRPAGVVMVVPFIDKVVKVRLDQIAGWERMSEDQLLDRISEIYQAE